MKVIFFRSQTELRLWLEANHDRVSELWIGFYNKQSGKGGLTYREALDEALCYGWIDGIRKNVDEDSYTNRFTARQPRSNWSLINIQRVEELKALGKMTPSGMQAFEARKAARSGIYSYEQPKQACPWHERAEAIRDALESLEVLFVTTARISAARDLVCNEREERRNPGAPAGSLD